MGLVKVKSFPVGEHFETELNTPSKAALRLPFYNKLPKDPIELMRWRIYVRERCLVDLEFRSDIWQMCAQDVAFFAVTFCWIHETRGANPVSFPLDAWPDQVDVMAWVAENIGQRDILVDKSRGIGMSWIFMVIVIWKWLFVDTADIALVSKDEDSLDLLDRPTTLMGKLDFLFKWLPSWMQFDENGKKILKRTTSDHKFENLRNGTAVIGYVPKDEKLRSGRYLFVLFDEFAFLERADMRRLMAASHGTTFCRIWLSTYRGTNEFYHMAHNFKSTKLRISTFWWNNPARFQGAYQSKNGRIEFLDKGFDYNLLGDYPFVFDDRKRSPWFDEQLMREGADMQTMLEELNGVAAIDTRKLFRPHMMKAARQYVRPPARIGYVDDDGQWRDDSEGPFKLFMQPGETSGPFMIGCDPSEGVPGGAFAGLEAINLRSGEQILSAGLTETPPVKFAQIAIAVSRFLAGERGDKWAKINYESGGSCGFTFGNELKRQKFGGIWKADPNKALVGWQNKDNGESVLYELGRAVVQGEVFLYCNDTVEELPFFEYNDKPNNRLVLDWMGTSGHGDRAIALAIAWHGGRKRRKTFLQAEEKEVTLLQGVEHEPAFKESRRKPKTWSDQYRRRKVSLV